MANGSLKNAHRKDPYKSYKFASSGMAVVLAESPKPAPSTGPTVVNNRLGGDNGSGDQSPEALNTTGSRSNVVSPRPPNSKMG